MALINVTVVSERSAVLPWKISSALLEKESIREYYYCLCTGTAILKLMVLPLQKPTWVALRML